MGHLCLVAGRVELTDHSQDGSPRQVYGNVEQRVEQDPLGVDSVVDQAIDDHGDRQDEDKDTGPAETCLGREDGHRYQDEGHEGDGCIVLDGGDNRQSDEDASLYREIEMHKPR